MAEGGAKSFGVFRVKNHNFTPKNHIFSNFRGGERRVRPLPPGSAPVINIDKIRLYQDESKAPHPNRKSYIYIKMSLVG
jgi:hypothetical protein